MTANLLKQVYYVAWGDVRFMRHNFLNIFVTSVMTPLLYLIAFGYGLRSGTSSIDGVSYISFVIPGIIALSSLSASFASTSTRMNVQRLYYKSFDEMMMCPISLHAVILGKCVQGLLRGFLACFFMYAVGLILILAGGAADALQLRPMACLCIIVPCMTVSLLGMTAALLAKSHQSMATFSALVITPMTFLCGTFFSVSALHPVFQTLLYCLPLTPVSEMIRAACLPDYLEFPWLCLLLVIAWGAVFYAANYWLLKNKKI